MPNGVLDLDRTRGREMIQSVDRAARILKELSGGSRRYGVSELSTRLGLAKGTMHGLLRTLLDHGFVEQDPETDKYQLGPAVLEFSSSYLDLNQLRSRSLAWSELLATKSDEAVRVGTEHSDGVLIVHHVFKPDTSLQILEVGAVLPMHATALGKAMLAYLPDGAQDDVIARGLLPLTSRTLATADALRKDLRLVRERRYAVEIEEAILGESGLAAPIFDRGGAVCGVIGIAGAQDRVTGNDERVPRLAEYVTEAARGISRDLGAVGWPPRL
jgi:DNA-binding IclR family transcriptional regulator